jgi:hypothetical protein
MDGLRHFYYSEKEWTNWKYPRGGVDMSDVTWI